MEGPGRSQHRSSVFLVAIAAPNGPNVRARLGPNVRAGILSFFRQRPPTIRRLRCLTFLAYSMRLTRQSLRRSALASYKRRRMYRREAVHRLYQSLRGEPAEVEDTTRTGKSDCRQDIRRCH